MRDSDTTASYVGQVERDPAGNLWAVLYCRGEVITRRSVRSLRQGKKCVSDLVLSAADNYPTGPMSLDGPTANRLMDHQFVSGSAPRSGMVPAY